MLARLLTAHDAMMSYDKTPETCKMVHSEEVKELYSDLMTLDQPHSQYYKDEYSFVVLKQWLTCSPESLLRHCCHYRDSASSGTNNYICLRLSNLSLSHIGSIEKLLWVQMLDLSHNQLSSIEGLRAMQLLSCLNLSNNKMGNFSALEPLTLLKSLKVLDISYNEIGAHVVDTRRQRALAKNYRSYGAWYHHKWVLSKGHSSADEELQLLAVFLKKDSRNFHAWNYRRFVAALKNRSDEEELHFTTDLINENFSNYSSWHNCSVILSHLLEKRAQGSFSKEKVLTEEYDFVHQALFTDPDDQSGWLYHLWLLEQTVKVENPLLVSTWSPHGSNLNV